MALRSASLLVDAGEIVALTGASGSGKSSLLHCLAGLVPPTGGAVWFGEFSLTRLSDAERSALRLSRMGFIFQFGDLVPELTLLENVMLPLQLNGVRSVEARGRSLELLGRLGIAAGEASRVSGAVSCGQAQRAAVARALVGRPSVVFADEPTGALNTATAALVLAELLAITREHGASALVVTHDSTVAAHADRRVRIVDGTTPIDAVTPLGTDQPVS